MVDRQAAMPSAGRSRIWDSSGTLLAEAPGVGRYVVVARLIWAAKHSPPVRKRYGCSGSEQIHLLPRICSNHFYANAWDKSDHNPSCPATGS